jgi:hypothetical protein
VGGDVVYVGVDGAVLAFPRDGCGAATCAPLARLPVPGSTRSLAIAQGHLVVASARADQPYAATATVTAFALP